MGLLFRAQIEAALCERLDTVHKMLDETWSRDRDNRIRTQLMIITDLMAMQPALSRAGAS